MDANKNTECPEPKFEAAKQEIKEADGTQGRKKRAVLSTSTAAAASNGVSVTDGSGDLASTEMTFSIDHIREQIFRCLPKEDLYNCRQACRSWNLTASLELQKRMDSICLEIGTTEFSQLLGLLAKRPESLLGLPLPYSKFSFEKESYPPTFLKNRAILSFLNKYGPGIQELSFASEDFDRSKAEENEVIDFVTNLLIHQTPNLSKLRINFKYSASWAEGGSSRKWNSTLLMTDPEFKEIHSKTWETNSKLKVLTLDGVSAKLLETVIQLAPNLREINASGSYFKASFCKYFMEPLNRLGYLKEITFDPKSVKEMEIFETICELTQSGNPSLGMRVFAFWVANLSLRMRLPAFPIPADMDYDPWPTPYFLKSPDMRARGEIIINRLLECSRNSLETIAWNPSTGLSGLKWPEVLPNIQKLTMGTLGDHVFPNAFSWSTTFPKLRRISLENDMGDMDFANALDLLFQKQTIESVKDVHVKAEEDRWIKKDPLIAAQFRRLQNIFPYAKINVCVPFFATLYPGSSKVQLCCRCDCLI